MRGRVSGQVRPESCLCVAAGSRNTALHCEVFSRTHMYTVHVEELWGDVLAKI